MEPHSFPRRPGGLTALVLDALDAKDAKDTSLFESVTDGALHEAKKPRVPDRTELKLAIQELEDEIDRVKVRSPLSFKGDSCRSWRPISSLKRCVCYHVVTADGN